MAFMFIIQKCTEIECDLLSLMLKLFLDPILTGFKGDFVFHQKCCPEISVA